MAGDAKPIAAKLANALITEAKPNAIARALSGASPAFEFLRKLYGGLWVSGTVTLTRDHLTFAPNALNRMVYAGGHQRTIPLGDVADVSDRFGLVTRIVDVTLSDGTKFTFRCVGAKAFAEKIAAAAQRCRAG